MHATSGDVYTDRQEIDDDDGDVYGNEEELHSATANTSGRSSNWVGEHPNEHPNEEVTMPTQTPAPVQTSASSNDKTAQVTQAV